MREVALALILVGCTGSDPEPDPDESAFGSDFLWGSATAGFQVDMGCPTWSAELCTDTASDWYAYVTTPALIEDSALHITGEPVESGPGMWETFEADAERMSAAKLNGYRMSLEWSRLFPDGAAEQATSVDELAAYADAEAVARYHEMFAAMEAEGITPLVTLNHYTLPLWVHDTVACHEDLECERDGWVDGDRITRLIALYAGFAGREFGGEVDLWVTLNEPFATTLSGYAFPGEDRSAPPGRSLDVPGTIAVMLHQIEGHAVMYDAVHAEDQVDADGDGDVAEVGIVMNMTAIHPDPDAADPDAAARGAQHMDYLYHQLYINALQHGDWDPDLDGVVDETRTDLAGRLDFLGINYYNRVDVLGFPFPLIGEIPTFDFYPEFSWDPYPEGLGQVIDRASEWDVPLYISENGTPHVQTRGEEILDGHIEALQGSVEGGADVRGYFYWSFVDNYEWNHGFDLLFGLYALDLQTKERTARPVLSRYTEIIEAGGL